MSIALGNEKPQQLLEVEKIIWRALITLSLGMTPPEDVLGGLVHSIPWDNLQPLLNASHQDSEWFIPQTMPPSSILPVAVSDTPGENAMDLSIDNQPQQSPLTTIPALNDNTMDQALDHVPQSSPPPPLQH